MIVLFGCKPKQNQADSVDPSKIPKYNMVELETDLPLAKDDRTQKPRQKSGEKFMVPQGTKLLSRGVEVTSSDDFPILGELELITDGNKEKANYFDYHVELMDGLQWVQLDIERQHTIYAILVWHYYYPYGEDYYYSGEYDGPRVYQDVVVQISNDPAFENDVTTVFNNDHDNTSGLGVGGDDTYIETSEGLWIGVEGVQGRYVRLYSNGYNDLAPKGSTGRNNPSKEKYFAPNHYIEVEVYGM
jgi:hypothetical protein